MQTADQILAILRMHGPELQRLGIRRLGSFGSAARGEATENSDLAFLVELERQTFDGYPCAMWSPASTAANERASSCRVGLRPAELRPR